MLKAEYKDKEFAVDILVKSFDDNKSINYIIKQDKQRVKRLRILMGYSFDLCFYFGKIYFTDDRI